MTDKELNERLALKVGFKDKSTSLLTIWELPHKSWVSDLPDFTHDFNACLKWIVPVLRERGLYEIQFKYILGGDIDCYLFPLNLKWVNAHAKTESLAFCLAADKFLSEVK
jgi:hypothetical protein